MHDFVIQRVNVRDIARAFTIAFAENRHGFKKTDKPKEGDIILFKGKSIYHCDILLGGKVLHSTHQKGGVVYQNIDDVLGFNEIEYWAYDAN